MDLKGQKYLSCPANEPSNKNINHVFDTLNNTRQLVGQVHVIVCKAYIDWTCTVLQLPNVANIMQSISGWFPHILQFQHACASEHFSEATHNLCSCAWPYCFFFFFFFFLPIWIISLHQQCRQVRSLFSNIFFRVKTIAETEEAMKAQNRAATERWGGESLLVTHNQLKVCCENNLTSQQCSSDLVGLPVPWPSLQGIFQQLAFRGLTS